MSRGLLRERSWKTKAHDEAWVSEGDDVTYHMIDQRHYLDAIGCINTSILGLRVEAEGWLAICTCWQQPPAAPCVSAKYGARDKSTNCLPATIPGRDRRHAERGVIFEQP